MRGPFIILGALGALIVAGRHDLAHADCRRTGDSVLCDGLDPDGFVTSNALVQVTVAPTGVVENIHSSDFDGYCEDLATSSAIGVGSRGTVLNQGRIFGLGICGTGIAAGNGSTIVNAGAISTTQALAYAIDAGSDMTIRNAGQITTTDTLSLGIHAGDRARIETTVGSSILTSGAAASAIAVGAGASITNAGQLAMIGSGDVMSLGADATIVNTGTISATAGSSNAIRAVGGSVSLTNSGSISAVNTGVPVIGPGAAIAVNADSLALTNTGTITGSYTGLSVNASISTTVINSGVIAGGGERLVRDNAVTESDGIVIHGSGNVVLTNTGSIVGQGGVAAIRSDATTTLINRGSIRGDVLLSQNADFVTLGPGSALDGVLDGGGGDNRLLLDGFGTQTKSFTHFSALTKIGSGTWTLQAPTNLSADAFVTVGTLAVASGGGLAVPRMTVSTGASFIAGDNSAIGALSNAGIVLPGSAATPGTLIVTGDYVQGTGATLRTRIAADGTADRLRVGGSATLAGTLQIESLGRIPSGDFILLSFAGSTGGFASAVTPQSAFMTSRLVTTATGIVLQVQRTPYASVAITASQRALATMLDRQTAPSPLLVSVLDTLERGGAAAAQPLFTALTSDAVPAVTTLALAAMGTLGRSELDILAGPAGGGPRLWGQFLNRHGHTRAGIAAESYDNALSGGFAGFDLAAGATARVGLSLASVDSAAHFATGAESHLPLTQISATATDTLTAAGLQLLGRVAYAGGTADIRRSQVLAGVSSRLTAVAAVDVWAADTRISMSRKIGPLTLVPHIGLSFASAHVGAFNEGAPLGLQTSAARTDSLRSELGSRLEFTAGRLQAFAGLGWSQELLPNRRQATATLIGTADTAFILSGAAPRRGQIDLDGGVAVDVLPGLSAYVRAGATVNDSLTGHHVTAGAVWHW